MIQPYTRYFWRGSPRVDTGQGTLFVVDDNALNREALTRRLARHGYTVTMAAEGQQAFAQITAQPAAVYVHFTALPPEVATFFQWLLAVETLDGTAPSRYPVSGAL